MFTRQIAAGGPVTVTHADMVRYFMTIPEASQLILQALALGKGGELFVLDMGEPIKIRFLAEQMIPAQAACCISPGDIGSESCILTFKAEYIAAEITAQE